MAETMIGENPELCMDDAVDVVLEWILCAGRDEH
jgi:hypothetical protein